VMTIAAMMKVPTIVVETMMAEATMAGMTVATKGIR
jgi:hypothetical protein